MSRGSATERRDDREAPRRCRRAGVGGGEDAAPLSLRYLLSCSRSRPSVVNCNPPSTSRIASPNSTSLSAMPPGSSGFTGASVSSSPSQWSSSGVRGLSIAAHEQRTCLRSAGGGRTRAPYAALRETRDPALNNRARLARASGWPSDPATFEAAAPDGELRASFWT